jgi:sec-independent protein translocase protein TatA
MPFGIGLPELLILLLVLLLVFGPKRLPEMGRQLGKGMREFKDSVSGKDDDEDDDDRAALSPPPPKASTGPERKAVPVSSEGLDEADDEAESSSSAPDRETVS